MKSRTISLTFTMILMVCLSCQGLFRSDDLYPSYMHFDELAGQNLQAKVYSYTWQESLPPGSQISNEVRTTGIISFTRNDSYLRFSYARDNVSQNLEFSDTTDVGYSFISVDNDPGNGCYAELNLSNDSVFVSCSDASPNGGDYWTFRAKRN